MDSFNIQKHTNSKDISLNNGNSIKTDDNVSLNRQNEDIRPRQQTFKTSSNSRPNLTNDNDNTQKSRPKLVPFDGLELLTNPKKTFDDHSNNSAKNSDNSDSDSISEYSTDDDNANKFEFNSNMFKSGSSSPHREKSDDEISVKSSSSSVSSKSKRSRSSMSSSSSYKPQKSYEEILREKQILLFKLDRLEKSLKIKAPRKFTMQSNYEDIKYEYEKLKRQRDVDKSIKFQRKALMAVVSGFEYLNTKFDPIDAKLDGWSESVMENIDDYDEVFEELHDKYAEKVQVVPELKLLMMVGGSAFMFHLSNTLFKSNVPSLNEILKQNPDIMRNITQAAMNNMNQQMGGSDPIANMMQQGVNMQQQKRDHQMGNSMSGPNGVDDILSEINNGGRGGQQRGKSGGQRRPGINIDL